MQIFTKIFVSIFYIGFIKFAPGTWGSLTSIIMLFSLFNFFKLSLPVLITIFVILFFISNFLINYFSSFTDSYDSKHIIIDELIGIYIIFFFYDFIFIYNDIVTLMLIFFIFRFFDIVKIYPANFVDQKIKNGYGVIMDDIIAGIYTVLLMVLINVII